MEVLRKDGGLAMKKKQQFRVKPPCCQFSLPLFAHTHTHTSKLIPNRPSHVSTIGPETLSYIGYINLVGKAEGEEIVYS
jgi:hypothetical protein